MKKEESKLYKWQQAYIDDIKSCNTGSPDREKDMLKDYKERGEVYRSAVLDELSVEKRQRVTSSEY